MIAPFLLLSWDDLGFDEFDHIASEACDPDVAGHIRARTRVANTAYANTGTRSPITRLPAEPAVLRQAVRQLSAHVGRQTAALRKRLQHVDGRFLLGAVAGLGAINALDSPDLVAVPGRFDRELEWLSHQVSTTNGEVPTWSETLDALTIARQCLIVEYYAPAPDASRLEKLRQRSVMAGDLGMTYPPIATDIAQRLLTSAIRRNSTIQDSHLGAFVSHTDEAFAQFAEGLRRILLAILPSLSTRPDERTLLTTVIRSWTVKDIVNTLALDSSLSSKPVIRDLTTVLAATARNDVRSRPFLTLGDTAILLLPRRVLCDRHDLLDQAVSRFVRSQPHGMGNYPDLRARMLDDVVVESLTRILPGSRAHVGELWQIDGRPQERDVVVFYEDVAICVETKAPRLNPSRRSGFADVVNVLRDDIAKGVDQVCSLADMLEAGSAKLASGRRAPVVRKVYRLVASFNGWWGIDLAVDDLVHLGVLPAPDAAMITSVDKLICYETLLNSPSAFISYLDHRLDHQRRPWLVVADEFELIGGYFTNPRDNWQRRPARGTVHIVHVSFQADVDLTIQAAYTGTGGRSPWLQGKHTPLISNALRDLETRRPDAWLHAWSALSRLPLITQEEIDGALRARRRPPLGLLRSIDLANRTGIVVIAQTPEHVSERAWARVLTNVPAGIPLIAVSWEDRRVLAVRGLDDANCWVDPEWATALRARNSSSTAHAAPAVQRQQPRRRTRRTR